VKIAHRWRCEVLHISPTILKHLAFEPMNENIVSGEGGSRTHKSWRIAAYKADGLLTGAQPLRKCKRAVGSELGPHTTYG
jgi:hypothetical protein